MYRDIRHLRAPDIWRFCSVHVLSQLFLSLVRAWFICFKSYGVLSATTRRNVAFAGRITPFVKGLHSQSPSQRYTLKKVDLYFVTLRFERRPKAAMQPRGGGSWADWHSFSLRKGADSPHNGMRLRGRRITLCHSAHILCSPSESVASHHDGLR